MGGLFQLFQGGGGNFQELGHHPHLAFYGQPWNCHSAYLRLLIFLPGILIPACDSFNPHYSLSSPNCCFLTYIQVFQEPGKVVICTLMLCQFIYPIDFLGSLIFLQVSYQLLQSRNYISSRVFWVMKLTKFQEPLSSKINKIVNIVLLIHKNEWNNAIYSTIDGHRDCHTVK